MDNDVKRLAGAMPGFNYRHVPESGKLQRCCSRWPLLAAVHRALATQSKEAAPVIAHDRDGVASLWEE